jgi:uncharacterized protein YukE
MSKELTRANIIDARSAIDAYESSCNGIYESLQSTLTGLTSSNWTGDGADGCMYFFNSTVTPALTEGLTSISKALRDILDNVELTFLDTLDPQLGDANRNPGGA